VNSEFVKRPRVLLPFLGMFSVPLRLKPMAENIFLETLRTMEKRSSPYVDPVSKMEPIGSIFQKPWS
jgi:hypothetical protein